ncbi:PQ loop repeat domain-containing protein [Ditylenchus destructor]|uniref:PQ loop repeat domain-containing protein n=1 Tax=Ditylenchus destructor TaxID=166010 RepID=A0AAD4N528_9BILA|nr:PQ loop repeat domain-containing protein [Ditylenchus destructor]
MLHFVDMQRCLWEARDDLEGDIKLQIGSKNPEITIDPTSITITPQKKSATVTVRGLAVTSRSYVDVDRCWIVANGSETDCPFNTSRTFVTTKVVKSNVISVIVYICGFIFFIAWSISFYPQIILNYRRKSVIGLNFDFLLLNFVGFGCYTVYNILFFFDDTVQDIYLSTHPHNLIPVLINDVIFASHAFFVCIVTGIQCFIYERGEQRISMICRGWSSLLVLLGIVSVILASFSVVNWLQFIYLLSYIKMAVTVSKYLPQAILNYKRKSTVGWSIGNILLDFTGGCTDIFQMVLQATNTDDWSVFTGNPVKFGIGSVSIFFDIFFMIQHYILYRHSNQDEKLCKQESMNGSVAKEASSL